MPVPEIGFCPQIEAVTIGADRFDLTSWDGVRAWLQVDAPQEIHLKKQDEERCSEC